MVLWFLVEGVDMSVMIRFTRHGDATIAHWLNRMGSHAQGWHNRRFRDLVFVVLQLDELYTRVRDIASARWLWLAIDPVSKAISSLHVRGRTKQDAYSKRSHLFAKLQQVGLRRLIQTAFIERVNLTFRQCVSCLSRRTWSYAQSE